jgi:hypothetical protein
MSNVKIYLDSPPPELGLTSPELLPSIGRHLMTFHSGHAYSLAAERLARQAKTTGWFASVDIFHPASEHAAMQAFNANHGEFVSRNPRGYGCWRWKPLLVQAMLAALPENDHLYYMDAGCELSVLGSARFAALDRELAVRGVLCFEIGFAELGWCKHESVDAIFGGWNDAAMASRQIQATWFGLRNTASVRKRIAEWAQWAVRGELITDSYDPRRQHPSFQNHRHDQALWSLVLKKHGIRPLPQEDCFERWLYVRDSWVLLSPVHGLRSRGGRSRIDGIASSSSEDGCRNNLRSPSTRFKGRLATSHIRAEAFDLLRRLRARMRPA